MGLTPVSGLPGATRSGSIDPTLIFHYIHGAAKISHEKSLATPVGVTEAEYILNKKSGWQALAGSSDFSEIIQKKDRDEGATLACDISKTESLTWLGHTGSSSAGKLMRLSSLEASARRVRNSARVSSSDVRV
jgi:acetate kinase